MAEPVDVCGMLSILQRHTGNTMIILCDMYIHHALMRFLYGGSYATKGFQRYLKVLPQVYGTRHPYKYPLTLLYTQHLPIIACLLFSNLTTETSFLLHHVSP